MTKKRLWELQQLSRMRNLHEPEQVSEPKNKVINISKIKFFELKKKQPEQIVEVVGKKKLGRPRGSKNPIRENNRRQYISEAYIPDPPKEKIVRHKAVYDNIRSPFGIASELHQSG